MNANVAITAREAADTRCWTLRCPVCSSMIGSVDLAASAAIGSCGHCGFIVANRGGIWRALAPMRELYYRKFAAEYSATGEREGRGSQTADYYLSLPYRDLSGHNAWQWRMRARTFEYITSRLIAPLEGKLARPLRVLDIGAGFGWMSYRLGLLGHSAVAVDLIDNTCDGLGAAWHYDSHLARPLACVQAEMDNLPFGACQFDVAVFNASLHYSENYTRTLREAIRCLRPGGELIVADTPFYEREETARAMVLAKHVSDCIRSMEYVTPRILSELERTCGIRWRIGRPWYGMGWALRPWKALLRGYPEPSKFYTFSATIGG